MAGPISDGDYFIRNRATRTALWINDKDKIVGHITDPQVMEAQVFHIRYQVNPSYYTFTNVWTGKVIELPNGNSSNGTHLLAMNPSTRQNQQWKLQQAGPSNFYTVVNIQSNTVIDLASGDNQDGAAVIGWTFHGGQNQQWEFVPYVAAGQTEIEQLKKELEKAKQSGRGNDLKVIVKVSLETLDGQIRMIQARESDRYNLRAVVDNLRLALGIKSPANALEEESLALMKEIFAKMGIQIS